MKAITFSFKLFREVLLLWGGPRIPTFVAINLCGPKIHSMYRRRKQHVVLLDRGLGQSNFKVLGKLYFEAMRNLGIKLVPVLAAEDETAILGQISYSESSDELVGFCRVSGGVAACDKQHWKQVSPCSQGTWFCSFLSEG